MLGKMWRWGVMALILTYMSCAPRPGIKPESPLDTPEAAYQRGTTLLEEGQYDAALGEFDRAIKLAQYQGRDFAPGYEGLALPYLGKGHLQLARGNIERALEIDDDYAPAYVGQGRIYYAQGKYKQAIGRYKQALKKDPHYAAAYYYMGRAYVRMDKPQEAEEAYKQALEIDPGYAAADQALEELQRITRAGMPPEYQQIAQKEAITRVDVAALFYNELPLERLMRRLPAEREEVTRIIPDAEGHWGELYIRAVVELGIMELYPDGTFRPEEEITRANFAMLLERLLIEVTGDEGLATRFIGSPSPFPDVSESNPFFNAIMTVTTRGLMKTRLDGTFGMMDPVPGWDGLLVLKTLKGQL